MKTVEEIMGLVESHRTSGGSAEHHATKEALKAEIEKLCADAARYQWLRAKTQSVQPEVARVLIMHRGQYVCHFGENLDANIDFAMKEAK